MQKIALTFLFQLASYVTAAAIGALHRAHWLETYLIIWSVVAWIILWLYVMSRLDR